MLRALFFILCVYLVLNLLFGLPHFSVAVDGVPLGGPVEGLFGVAAAVVAGLIALGVLFALLAGLVVMAIGLPLLLVAIVICALLAPILLPMLILLGLAMLFFCGLSSLFA